MLARHPGDAGAVGGEGRAVDGRGGHDGVVAHVEAGVVERGLAEGVATHHLEARVGAAHLEEHRGARRGVDVLERRGDGVRLALRRVGR